MWFFSERSTPFFFRSRSEEWPMSFGRIFGMFGNTWWITFTIFHCFLAPIDVVVHGHEDDAILVEVLRQNIEFFLRHAVDFTEELQRRAPWENLPLENDRFSINPVQFALRSRLSKPLKLIRPRFHRLWIFFNSTSKTQHRIGKRRTILLSITWWHVHVPWYFSFIEFDPSRSCSLQIFHPVDQGSISAKLENKGRISKNSVFLVTGKFSS